MSFVIKLILLNILFNINREGKKKYIYENWYILMEFEEKKNKVNIFFWD